MASPIVTLIAVLVFSLVADAAEAQWKPKVEIIPQIPHTQPIDSVAFSPDGGRVLSGGWDNTLKLWDLTAGRLLRTFEGHSGSVTSVVFSPDGARTLSGSHDGTLKLWDAVTGALIRTFEGHSDGVNSVAFSPDGARVLSGSSDNTIKLWEAATGALIRTFEGHSDNVNSVAFAPNGRQLISGSGNTWNHGKDNTLKLWDAVTGRLVRTFAGHSSPITSVAFSPNAAHVLSGSKDGTAKLWHKATGKLIRTIEGQAGGILSVAFSPDSKAVLLGSWNFYGGGDKTLQLWDENTGKLLHIFQSTGPVHSAAFSPDGSRVISTANENTLKLWNTFSSQLVRTIGGHAGVSAVLSVAFSPDGARILSSGFEMPLKMRDAATGQVIRNFGEQSLSARAVAFSPDGNRVAARSHNNALELWDAATGKLLRTFQAGGPVWCVAFSPDGTRLVSGQFPLKMGLTLWDAKTGQLLRTFEGHSSTITSVAFSPDGARVLSGSGELIDRSSSKDNTLKLWDTATGQLVRTFEGHSSSISSVAYSPDGAHVLSGSYDKTLKLWDAATGALLHTFVGHSAEVRSAAFSPNGTLVLSGSDDHTLKLWDASTGRAIRTLEGHLGSVTSVAFSPDGSRIISGSWDTTVRVWNVQAGELSAIMAGTGDGEWIAITPAGFFGASGKGADQALSVVRGFDVTAIGQVHQSLFNPDLVRVALAGDPDGEVREAAKVINLEKVVDSGPAPSVVIISHPPESHSSSDLVTLQARASDRGKGIGRIEWRVNGITVAVAAKPKGSGPDYALTQQLTLDPGDNTIEVVAYNESNILASLPAHTTITFAGSAAAVKPTLHVLAIGINAYRDQGWTPPGSAETLAFPPLSLAVSDAKALAAALKKAGVGQYADVKVTEALDGDASLAHLQQTIERLASEISPRDTFVLFAAAHGTSHQGRFYLIPQDYDGGTNPALLQELAIGQDRLQDWVANKIKAKKTILLLDTCESGALVAGYTRSRTDVPASEAAIGRLHEATGRPVLTAAAEGKPAFEGYEGHGVFTWALLDALKNGDRNGNGYIELSELVAHVQDQVPKISAKLNGRGRAAVAARGSTDDRQSAHFGSRGEDYALVRRLQ